MANSCTPCLITSYTINRVTAPLPLDGSSTRPNVFCGCNRVKEHLIEFHHTFSCIKWKRASSFDLSVKQVQREASPNVSGSTDVSQAVLHYFCYSTIYNTVTVKFELFVWIV